MNRSPDPVVTARAIVAVDVIVAMITGGLIAVIAGLASPGTIGGLPASVFWLAFHGLAWDTGARTTEILSLRWEWLDARGRNDVHATSPTWETQAF